MATLVNRISIDKKCKIALNAPKYKKFFHSAANARFQIAKYDMLNKDLPNHLVSKELQQSEAGKAGSQLISEGSLRAFLGLYEEDNPVEDLKGYLDQTVQLDDSDKAIITNTKTRVNFGWKIFIPTKEDLYTNDKFKLFWTNKTWIYVVEKGGIGATLIYFIFARLAETAARFKELGSRSGFGLQLKYKSSKKRHSFAPILYISSILDKFKARFPK